jgi:acyl carrier protein
LTTTSTTVSKQTITFKEADMESQIEQQTTAGTDELERAMLTLIAEQIQSSVPLNRETRIEMLDVDSLDMVEIAQAVYDDFGIRLEAQAVHEAETVGDILDAVTAAGR